MSRVGFAGLVAGAMLIAAPAMASERVVNGDFSAGDSGFSTSYVSYPAFGENDALGNYWVFTDPAVLCGSCFPSIGDHTTGTGNLLDLDGAGNAGVVAWSETMSVVPNTDYHLSFWATSLGVAGPQPDIIAQVDGGTVLDTGFLPSTTGVTATTWLNFTKTVNSGASSTLTLSFIDTTDTHAFNDLAMDDISLTGPSPAGAVPEPGTWAMLLAGLGAAGAALRSRRRSAAALA